MAALGGQYQVVPGPLKMWRITIQSIQAYQPGQIITDFDQLEQPQVAELVKEGVLNCLVHSTDNSITVSTAVTDAPPIASDIALSETGAAPTAPEPTFGTDS